MSETAQTPETVQEPPALEPQKKPSFIRNLFQYKLKIVMPSFRKKAVEAPVQEAADASPEQPVPVTSPSEPAEIKLEKPVKIKKSKPKSPRPSKNVSIDKKKPKAPIVAAILGLAAVCLGLSIFFFIRSGNTPEKRLEKADKYRDSGKYEKAAQTYDGLISDDIMIADAYLGLGETLIASGDTDGAILKLKLGFEATGDERIGKKLEELAPDEVLADDQEAARSAEDTPIVWADPELGSIVHELLGKTQGEEITPSDLSVFTAIKILGAEHAVSNLQLSGDRDAEPLNSINRLSGYTLDGVVYTERGDIRSLADISHFRNLKKLTIAYNSIDDIRGIEKLKNLEVLGLYCNNISDLTPLSGLSNLKYLYIYNNNISDISPLASATGLKQLYLQYNSITDISPLVSISELAELSINNNNVSDISVVAQMPYLMIFHADNNRISDISPISDAYSISDISFSGNPLGESPLSE